MRGYNFTSTGNKLLGLQAALRPNLYAPFKTATSLRNMSPTSLDPEINRLLDFWFSGGSEAQKKWFMGGEPFDQACRSQFEPLVKRARSKELSDWTESPSGTLALLILLDQIPRNIYRGSGEAFASDNQARDISVKAIATGVDKEVETLRRAFFYLPLMHQEDLIYQVACLSAFEQLAAKAEDEGDEIAMGFMKAGLDMTKKHITPIMKFGRYPGRNEALGRESSVEEKEFLKEFPGGF